MWVIISSREGLNQMPKLAQIVCPHSTRSISLKGFDLISWFKIRVPSPFLVAFVFGRPGLCWTNALTRSCAQPWACRFDGKEERREAGSYLARCLPTRFWLRYLLVMTNSSLLNMTIEIVDVPIEHGGFPYSYPTVYQRVFQTRSDSFEVIYIYIYYCVWVIAISKRCRTI